MKKILLILSLYLGFFAFFPTGLFAQSKEIDLNGLWSIGSAIIEVRHAGSSLTATVKESKDSWWIGKNIFTGSISGNKITGTALLQAEKCPGLTSSPAASGSVSTDGNTITFKYMHSEYDINKCVYINDAYDEGTTTLTRGRPAKKEKQQQPLSFPPISCQVDGAGSGKVPAVDVRGVSTSVLGEETSLSSEVEQTRSDLAQLDQDLSTAQHNLTGSNLKIKDLETLIREVDRQTGYLKKLLGANTPSADIIAMKNKKEALIKEHQTEGNENLGFKAKFEEINKRYKDALNKLDKLESQVLDEQFNQLRQQIKQKRIAEDEARTRAVSDRAFQQALNSYYERKDRGKIPKEVCAKADEGITLQCKSGETRKEKYACSYIGIDKTRDVPITKLSGNYALPKEDTDSLKLLFEVLDDISIVVDVATFGTTSFPNKIMDAMGRIANEMTDVFSIAIPVNVYQYSYIDTFTCETDGPCWKVPWRKETTNMLDRTTQENVEFFCVQDSNYNLEFSFPSEKPGAGCIVPKSGQVLSQKMWELYGRAKTNITNEYNIINDVRCPSSKP